jgi:hypothetical protein
MEPLDIPYPVQSSKKKFPWFMVMIVIIAAVIIGALVTRQPKKTEEKKDVVTETPSPTPTEAPKIEKSSVKIQVQNGTGTPGQAGDVVKALEEAGYSSENITSTNADSYDHTTAVISARANYDQIVSDIKDTLKSTLPDFSGGSKLLDEGSEYDVVIITGGKLFETPTPSASASATPTPNATATPSPTPTP